MEPTFIIAEAGSNFRISDNPNINYQQALRLINTAVETGADAIKFQLFKASKLYSKNAGTADYLEKEKTIYEIIQESELPPYWLKKLKLYCDEKGIMFLCTPFDEQAVDELEKINIMMYKIASYSITNIPLLKKIARLKKPILLSTGASTIEDIEIAVNAIKAEGNNQITLLQCTAKYPTPLYSVNLKSIPFLKERFNLNVGLSDHSKNPIIAPLGAVALGASVIEKHFTTDNNLKGPDQRFGITPTELGFMVKSIRDLEQALGQKNKKVLDEEKELYDFCKNIIYASKNIILGENFSKDNLIILRKGKEKAGLEARYFEKILNQQVKRNIQESEPILEQDLEKQDLANSYGIEFRTATIDDMTDLFNWRNDEETRKNSLNTEQITLEQHKKWFEKSLKNQDREIFIISDRQTNKSIGTIRFDKRPEGFSVVSLNVSPIHRGKGYGTKILKLLSNYYLKNNPKTYYIMANIKPFNIFSIKAFEKAGYKKIREFEDKIEYHFTI